MNEPARTIVAVLVAFGSLNLAVATGFYFGSLWAMQLARDVLEAVYDFGDDERAVLAEETAFQVRCAVRRTVGPRLAAFFVSDDDDDTPEDRGVR